MKEEALIMDEKVGSGCSTLRSQLGDQVGGKESALSWMLAAGGEGR